MPHQSSTHLTEKCKPSLTHPRGIQAGSLAWRSVSGARGKCTRVGKRCHRDGPPTLHSVEVPGLALWGAFKASYTMQKYGRATTKHSSLELRMQHTVLLRSDAAKHEARASGPHAVPANRRSGVSICSAVHNSLLRAGAA